MGRLCRKSGNPFGVRVAKVPAAPGRVGTVPIFARGGDCPDFRPSENGTVPFGVPNRPQRTPRSARSFCPSFFRPPGSRFVRRAVVNSPRPLGEGPGVRASRIANEPLAATLAVRRPRPAAALARWLVPAVFLSFTRPAERPDAAAIWTDVYYIRAGVSRANREPPRRHRTRGR